MNTLKRLIDQFIPAHYEVTLIPDADSLTFTGSVEIKGSTTEDTSSVLLHSKNLEILNASINGTPATVSTESAHNEIELNTDALLGQGEHTIALTFSGKITQDMSGMYPSDFEHEGQKKRIIATQFESHHARQAFPCIDEPAAKAVFSLTLHSPKGSTVLSNTMPIKEDEDSNSVITTFKPTPKMSTYLLAFAFGDLNVRESKTARGTVVRSFAASARPASHLDYSVAEGVKVLEFFEDYFDTPYPLEKLDQIALPDFDAGAMENWGLVTYREVVLLADPDNRSISSEQFVSLVIAHELSHQWFGNLVTMKWWDDLWLNESFASMMEHLALDEIHPDWHQWEHYTAMDVLSTTSRDIHKDIMPISVEVNDPDLIETLFDPGIVYAKGGRLLKMLREYVGDDAFRKALQQYFVDFAYDNASRDDLWQAMTKASSIDVASLMNDWLTQPGMPVVSVSQEDNMLYLSQKRFIVDGSTDDTSWTIPLLANQELPQNVLEKQSTQFSLESAKQVIINTHASGHYLTNYSSELNLAALKDGMKDQTLSSEARISTLNDMLLLSRSGDQDLAEALDIAHEMSTETRASVWQLIARVFGTAQQMTEGDEEARLMLNSVRATLAREQYAAIGPEESVNDDPNTIQLRSILFAFMLGAEDEQTIAFSDGLIAKNRSALENIPAESRASVLASAVRRGDSELMNNLMKMYPAASPEMQLDITSALSSTKDSVSAQSMLEKALGENGFVRAQDLMRWLVQFLRNHHTRETMWNYLTQNWEWFEKALSSSKSFDFLPTYCAGVVTTDEWFSKYEEFFTPKLTNKYLKGNIVIGMSDASSRVAWRSREETLIKEWLLANTSVR